MRSVSKCLKGGSAVLVDAGADAKNSQLKIAECLGAACANWPAILRFCVNVALWGIEAQISSVMGQQSCSLEDAIVYTGEVSEAPVLSTSCVEHSDMQATNTHKKLAGINSASSRVSIERCESIPGSINGRQQHIKSLDGFSGNQPR